MKLVLMRHAHAAAAPGTPDHGRPLSARGDQDAETMGRWLSTRVSPISAVYCSTAKRARQTWELVAAQLADPPEATYSDELYRAGCDELLDLVAAQAREGESLLVIGHNPAISQAADVLLDEPFPDLAAGAVVVLDHDPPHSRLVDFAAP